MNNWTILQLTSYLDAHYVSYGPRPKAMKKKHWRMYLVERFTQESKPCKPGPASIVECKIDDILAETTDIAWGLCAMFVCPTCGLIILDGKCDCTQGEKFDGGML